MKKMIKIIFALGVLAILYQFFVILIMSKHDSTYSLKNEDDSYMIEENYKKSGNFHMYSLKISDEEKNVFVASYNKDLNRQSRIIKEIKTYKSGEIYCIAPVLKDKVIENISCQLRGEQVSISYLRQVGNQDVNSFISALKDDGYEINEEIDKESKIIKTENNISIYDNIDDNLYITMWGYKKLYTLKNKEIEYKDLLNKDLYFNDYGILCGKYYVLMNTDDKEFLSFYVVNIKDGGKANIDFNFSISRNSYFNGIYDGKIYLTDIDNEKQYVINPASEKIEEVGTNKKAKYYDGESLKDVDIVELTKEKKYFISKKIDEKIIKKYKDYDLIESYGNYYYKKYYVFKSIF